MNEETEKHNGGSNSASSDNIGQKNPTFLYADRPTDSIFVTPNDGNTTYI